MKTLIYFLTIIFLLSLGQAHAQLSIGLKTGTTRVWQDYGNIPEAIEYVHRLDVAIKVYYDLGKHVSLGIEPGFVQRGGAWKSGFFEPFGGKTLFVDYLKTPVMLAGRLPIAKGRMEVFAKLGAGSSYLINASIERTINVNPVQSLGMSKVADKSFLHRWDHGAYGGLGLAVNWGSTQILLEVEAYSGFRRVQRSSSAKNRSLSLSLGMSRHIF